MSIPKVEVSGSSRKQYTEQALSKAPYLRPLMNRLLEIGGAGVVLSNCNNGPLLSSSLVADKKLFDVAGLKIIPGGIHNGCHLNVLKVWDEHKRLRWIATGFALNHNIWRPHSWCFERKTGRILETTVPNEKYFGVELSKLEAGEFGRNWVAIRL